MQLAHFLIVSAMLFALGLYGIVTRRNAILVLMGVELVLNAANINLIAFSRYGTLEARRPGGGDLRHHPRRREAAIALAIVLNIYHRFQTVNVDEVSTLKE